MTTKTEFSVFYNFNNILLLMKLIKDYTNIYDDTELLV